MGSAFSRFEPIGKNVFTISATRPLCYLLLLLFRGQMASHGAYASEIQSLQPDLCYNSWWYAKFSLFFRSLLNPRVIQIVAMMDSSTLRNIDDKEYD